MDFFLSLFEATGRIHLCTFGECFFNLLVGFIDFFSYFKFTAISGKFIFLNIYLMLCGCDSFTSHGGKIYTNLFKYFVNKKTTQHQWWWWWEKWDQENWDRSVFMTYRILSSFCEGKRNAILDFNKLICRVLLMHICKRYIDCLHP